MDEPPVPDEQPRIPKSVIILGWVSFCTDMATEMIYPLIPLFVVQVLGTSTAMLGLIDGVAEGGSSGLRWIGGVMSDRLGRRKPFVLAGYALSALSKPVMGLAALMGGWPVFMLGRCTDRLGKSIRTGPRDALIADSLPGRKGRGAAFGLHRAMDSAGAVAGPLIGWLILGCWPRLPIGWLFVIAVIPGLLSAGLVALAVQERRRPPGAGRPPTLFQGYPSAFWSVLVVMGIFSIANSSDVFLVLKTSENGLSIGRVVLVFTWCNLIHALSATSLGSWSDRIGRRTVIAAGWLVYAAVYLGFGWAGGTTAPWILMAFYGIYQSLSDGVGKALISDVVPSAQRAGAIGLIGAVSGLGQLLGSVMTGALWQRLVPGTEVRVPFAIAAALAVIAAVLILGTTPGAAEAEDR